MTAVITPATAPVIRSVTFDQPAYPPGAKMTATVEYEPGTSLSTVTTELSLTGTDKATGQTTTLAGSYAVATPQTDQTAWTPADPSGVEWTPQTDTGSVATFTATAP